jgi:hypothetical protein
MKEVAREVHDSTYGPYGIVVAIITASDGVRASQLPLSRVRSISGPDISSCFICDCIPFNHHMIQVFASASKLYYSQPTNK